MRITRRAFAGLAGLAPFAAKASSLVSVPGTPEPVGPGRALVHGLGSTGGAAAWTPAQLPNLVAWYDAQTASTIILNGSTVAQWNDRSGNGLNISRARPPISRPTMQPDSTALPPWWSTTPIITGFP